MTIVIRPATAADGPFLAAMLEEAMNWNAERPRTTLEVESLRWPELPRYIEDWGRDGDQGFVAEDDGRPVGATWYRLFPADRPAFGFIDEETPELSVALLPEARGQGLGTRLLERLIAHARELGFSKISLNAELPNPARRIYAKLGFVEVGPPEEGYQTMVLTLADAASGTP